MTESTNDQMSEFEQALQENLEAQSVSVGDVVDGTIVAVHGDVALVDIGGKSEAVLDRSELDELGTGDPVEVAVIQVGEEIRVSRRLAIEERLKEKLAEAVKDGTPVSGKIAGRRKGGFDVTVAGIRGFCPASQISDRRNEDLDQHLGQTYEFRVLEYDPERHKLVVSRAVLLREAAEGAREATWEKLEEGAVLEGKVRSLTDFGAFVDLGGVDGLVHVTEISHRRVHKPSDVLEVGQEVRVHVLEADREKNRVSLSIKRLEPNPWDGAEERFAPGTKVGGTIVRKADFGFFVNLEEGIDGLLHVSQLPPGLDTDSEELAVGQPFEGWVRECDPGHERIGLTLREVPDHDPWERIEMHYQEGQVVEGTVENGAPFGVFVELEPGLSALIPVSELGMGRDIDPKTALDPGSRVKAKVLSIDPQRRRMSLSIRAYKRDRERGEYQKHMDSQTPEEPGQTAFGAALLKALGKTPDAD